jgi:hypothetical protein
MRSHPVVYVQLVSITVMTDIQRPESISGGCLCGAIRFTITFPDESDWPPLTVRTLLVDGGSLADDVFRTVCAIAPDVASTLVACIFKASVFQCQISLHHWSSTLRTRPTPQPQILDVDSAAHVEAQLLFTTSASQT